MKITKPYFVHLTTFNAEGPILFGLGKPPEPVSKNPQVVSAGYSQVKREPWNNKVRIDNRPIAYTINNRDGRIPAMNPLKN